jgi:hypothetical protein
MITLNGDFQYALKRLKNRKTFLNFLLLLYVVSDIDLAIFSLSLAVKIRRFITCVEAPVSYDRSRCKQIVSRPISWSCFPDVGLYRRIRSCFVSATVS